MSEQTQNAPIKETKELVSFLLAVHQAYQLSNADGKIDFKDLPHIYNPLMKSIQAFNGLDKIPAELKDLDDEERKELVELFKADFDLADDVLEQKIEEGFAVALQLAKFITGLPKKVSE